MKQLFLLLLTCTFYLFTSAQNFEYVINTPGDSTYNCYLKIIPDGEIQGLLVRDYSKLPDITKESPFKWVDLALDKGIMILYTATSKSFPNFYLLDEDMHLLDGIIAEVVKKHTLAKDKIIIGGISASGTRAIRYTQYCEQGKSKNGIKIAGVFGVDSPLDHERFYNSCIEILKRNYAKGNLEESTMVKAYYEKELGNSPRRKRHYKKYVKASVYTQTHPEKGNAKWLRHVPIRLYHEPDIDWWLKEKQEAYYNINSVDIAGLINYLQLEGNKQAELITTTGKGYDRNHNRKPHSWTIVDEPDLINWVMLVLGI